MKVQTLAFLLLIPVFSSCFISRRTANEPLQEKRMETLQTGTSTAADVAATLGAPNEVVQLGKRMAWRYDFTNAKTAGFTILILTFINEDARADRAWLFFDENSVLQYAGSTLEAKHAGYAMPWQDIHD
ncbi:MAG: hypothetical protein JNL28_17610 [Planctomycetes bacterium]|nr:hypothetical protein [Planctomycetota bacterium]